MAEQDLIVRSRLNQNELCVIDNLLAERLRNTNADKKDSRVKFIKRLKRKIHKNIKVKSDSYNYSKKVVFVSS